MKLKKNPSDNYHYLHSDQDQALICPHQDHGTEIRIEQPKLDGQQPKQFIDKRHMVCGSWCALFRIDIGVNFGRCTQSCSNGSEFIVKVEE